MAAPLKVGLNYFPLEVDADQDDKLSMIIGEFGEKGELLFYKLCGWIYKHGGYGITWDDQELLKFAKRVAYIGGSSANLVKEVVARCIKWGLFDKALFESFHVLTSVRIQTTWFEATRKRKERTVPGEIWLLPENSSQNPVKIVFRRKAAEETPEKAALIVQSKSERESKVNDYVGERPQTPPIPPKPPRPPKPSAGIPDDARPRTMEQLADVAKLDEEIIAWAYRQGIMPEAVPALVDAFALHCKNRRKTHINLIQYQQHLVSWYPKRNRNNDNATTSAATTTETDQYLQRRQRAEARDSGR